MTVVGGAVNNDVTEALERELPFLGFADPGAGCCSNEFSETLVGLILTGLWLLLLLLLLLVYVPLSMVARR